MMICDVEHHFMPEQAWLKQGGKRGQKVRVFSKEGKEIMPLEEAYFQIEKHLEYMDIAGIDMAVLSGTPFETLEECRLWNEECASVVDKNPSRFIGFASVMPLGGEPAFREMKYAVKELGMRGVMITGQVEGLPLDSKRLSPFYQKVSELGVPIFVHPSAAAKGFDACNAPYNLNTLVREFDLITAVARLCLGGVMEEFPGITFIIAHFGGGISSMKERLERYVRYCGASFWHGMEKPPIREPYLERFEEHFDRLYFDMAGREVGMATVRCALTNISPRRLMFGTDYPPNFVDDPTGIKRYIGEIRKLDLGEDDIRAMLGLNAARLLGL